MASWRTATCVSAGFVSGVIGGAAASEAVDDGAECATSGVLAIGVSAIVAAEVSSRLGLEPGFSTGFAAGKTCDIDGSFTCGRLT